MDFLNRVIEQSKGMQQKIAEAMTQGAEAAKPLVADAVAKAQDLQKTIVEQAPNVTSQTQAQLNAAMKHAGDFIVAGKSVLEAGVNGAQSRIAELKQHADETASAAETAQQDAPKA